MTRSTCLWSWCCGLMLVLSLVSCSKTPKPGEVLDEARLRRASRSRRFPPPMKIISMTWTRMRTAFSR